MSTRLLHRTFLLLLIPALVGCSSLPQFGAPTAEKVPAPPVECVPPEPAAPQALSRAESLLAYFEYAKDLGSAQWTKEHERVRLAFAKDRSDALRIQYALLLSVPNAGHRDSPRALQLLEPVIADTKDHEPGVRELALLLAADIGERRRLDESLMAANQRYKDEQARVAELEVKLEALKAIEKTLSQRERKPLPRRPPVQPTQQDIKSE